MSFILVGSNTTYTPAPAGNHVARCCWMIDLGTQTDTFQGREESARKLMLGFELPEETHIFREEDGPLPYIVSREFRASLHKKAALRAFLEGWRGRAFTEEELKGFDLAVLIGKECLVNVVHKTSSSGRTRAEITGAARLPKGAVCPPAVMPRHLFHLGETLDIEALNRLPEWIREKLQGSPEYRKLVAPQSPPNHSAAADEADGFQDDDIPFAPPHYLTVGGW